MIEIIDFHELWDENMKQFALQVLEGAIGIMDLPVAAELSLTVATEEEIREINAEQRQIDKVTDVLSFPMLDFAEPMEAEAFAEQAEFSVNPETGNLFLGDIVLCFERAKEQAKEYGHSLEREVAFLLVHSLLHLLGYDHMTQEEEKEMFAKQEEILEIMKIYR